MHYRFEFDPGASHYGVMGNPIAHSRSPQIHRAFARQTDQTLEYQAIYVEQGEFERAVELFRLAGGLGLNVTIPFKEDAFALTDVLSDRAKRAGAVNTLRFKAGKAHGDNTDGYGLVSDIINNHRREIADQKILILGAGGAVRGVLAPLLAQNPLSIVIANRTVSKARELAEKFNDLGRLEACGYPSLAGQRFDLIINGTSTSLQGAIPPIPDDVIAPTGWCYDMAYAAQPTPFMSWALEQGARYAVDGLGMLVEQAAESFFIWRGVKPETAPVIEELLKLSSP